MDEKKNTIDQTIEKVEESIKQVTNDGIHDGNIEYLYKLVDIHKDLKNELLKKEEIDMRYGEYSYGARGVPGTGRGRYRGESYGRRGVPGTGRGRYRGEEDMEEMSYHYGNYSEGKEMYGNDPETMDSFQEMLKSLKKFYKHLEQEADPQEAQMLRETVQEMANM